MGTPDSNSTEHKQKALIQLDMVDWENSITRFLRLPPSRRLRSIINPEAPVLSIPTSSNSPVLESSLRALTPPPSPFGSFITPQLPLVFAFALGELSLTLDSSNLWESSDMLITVLTIHAIPRPKRRVLELTCYFI